MHLGGFHTQLSYLNAQGKSCAGSGLEELAVAGGLVASEMYKILFGKIIIEENIYISRLLNFNASWLKTTLDTIS